MRFRVGDRLALERTRYSRRRGSGANRDGEETPVSASYSRGSTTFAVAVALVIVTLTASPANAKSVGGAAAVQARAALRAGASQVLVRP